VGQAESYFHLQVQKLCQINRKNPFVHVWQYKLNTQHKKLNEKLFIDSKSSSVKQFLRSKLVDFRSDSRGTVFN
jgi:hypothetical protein